VCGFYFSSEPARDTKLTTHAFTQEDFFPQPSELPAISACFQARVGGPAEGLPRLFIVG
jgi:hypothetical protein